MEENLMKKIDEVEKKIDLIMELFLSTSLTLTTYSEVAKYLKKTTRSLRNYVLNGEFEQNIHYYKDKKNRTIFIAQGIIDYKSNVQERNKDTMSENKVVKPKLMNPIVAQMLKGI